eukprot:PhM_4_TR16218/c0_g2_i1/m.94548
MIAIRSSSLIIFIIAAYCFCFCFTGCLARPPCSRIEDYRYSDGRDYRGQKSTTKSGYTCQKWSVQYPHAHPSDIVPDSAHGLGDHNYCRNPYWESYGGKAGCYTTDPNVRWEDCDIGPVCDPATMPQVSVVTASPRAESQPFPLRVHLYCDTTGAVIYYTLDGSTPDDVDGGTATQRYDPTKGIVKSSAGALIIRAMGVKDGYLDGPVLRTSYTVVEPITSPVKMSPDPSGVVFDKAITVTFSCDTNDVVYHYTTDGSEPTYSSEVYRDPIPLDSTTTINAFADRYDLQRSQITSATFVIRIAHAAPVDVVSNPSGVLYGGTALTFSCTTPNSKIVVFVNDSKWSDDAVHQQPLLLDKVGVARVRSHCSSPETQDGPESTNFYSIIPLPLPEFNPPPNTPSAPYRSQQTITGVCACIGCYVKYLHLDDVNGTTPSTVFPQLTSLGEHNVTAWCVNRFSAGTPRVAQYYLAQRELRTPVLVPPQGHYYVGPLAIRASPDMADTDVLARATLRNATTGDLFETSPRATLGGSSDAQLTAHVVIAQTISADETSVFMTPSSAVEATYWLFTPLSADNAAAHCTPLMRVECYHEDAVYSRVASALNVPEDTVRHTTLLSLESIRYLDEAKVEVVVTFRVCGLPERLAAADVAVRVRDEIRQTSRYQLSVETPYVAVTDAADVVATSDPRLVRECFHACRPQRSEWFTLSTVSMGCTCSNVTVAGAKQSVMNASLSKAALFRVLEESGDTFVEGLSYVTRYVVSMGSTGVTKFVEDDTVRADVEFYVLVKGVNLPVVGGVFRIAEVGSNCERPADGAGTTQALNDGVAALPVLVYGNGTYEACFSTDGSRWSPLRNSSESKTARVSTFTVLPPIGRTPAPTLLPALGGYFTESVTLTVRLELLPEGTTVRYAVNDSTTWEVLQGNGVVIGLGETTVRAYASAPGIAKSDVVSGVFTVRPVQVLGYRLSTTRTEGTLLRIVGSSLITDGTDVIKVTAGGDCSSMPVGHSGLLTLGGTASLGWRETERGVELNAPNSYQPLTVCYGRPAQLHMVPPLDSAYELSVARLGLGQCDAATAKVRCGSAVGSSCSAVLYQGLPDVLCTCAPDGAVKRTCTGSMATPAMTDNPGITVEPSAAPPSGTNGVVERNNHMSLMVYIGVGGGVLLLMIVVVVFVVRSFKNKKRKKSSSSCGGAHSGNTSFNRCNFRPQVLESEPTEADMEELELRNLSLASAPSGSVPPREPTPPLPPPDPSLPPHLVCPLTRKMYVHPVTAADGFTYEESAFKAYLERGKSVSPVTKMKLPNKDYTVNEPVREEVTYWREHQQRIDAVPNTCLNPGDDDGHFAFGSPSSRNGDDDRRKINQ